MTKPGSDLYFIITSVIHPSIVLCLIFTLCRTAFRQGIYYFDYLIDKAEYVKNCVNKARPKMHCKGKCQLMKKIQEQEKNQQKAPEMKLENKNEVISSKSYFIFFQTESNKHSNSFDSFFITARLIDRSFAIFHPPIV